MKSEMIKTDNLSGFSELSRLEMKKINGGFWPIVLGVIAACSGLAYLYEFGYNMVDQAFEQ